MPARLVLASASPARAALLRAAGVDPGVRVSGVDERALQQALGPLGPETLVGALAAAKARAVASCLPSGGPAGEGDGEAGPLLVLGCDSVLDLDGEALGRPVDQRDVVARWRRMAGREGVLRTGHHLVRLDAGAVTAEASTASATTVRFGEPDEEELGAYVATGEPMAVAGSFTLDGRGGWFVRGVDGSPSGVVGLCLPTLRDLLTEVGVRVPDLWVRPRTG